MRINTPCRSAKCSHSQCFDATSWYAMMQQTTTWYDPPARLSNVSSIYCLNTLLRLCPVCENVLDWRELIIDGYDNISL
jgi:E3 SUMO-protein ligase PIAS1